MQKKILSTYKITHADGNVEVLNAASMFEALGNLNISEETAPATAAIRTQSSVPSLIPDEPTEVIVQVYIDPEAHVTNCYATPNSATMHAGDDITLEAFAGKGYKFIGWKSEGKIISTNSKFVFTVPEPEIPGATMNILAEFELADIAYTVKVEPLEAIEAGCAAGPSATVPANAEAELYAVTGETYKFDNWSRGESDLGATPVLKTTVTPLAEDEKDCIYIAHFSLKE